MFGKRDDEEELAALRWLFSVVGEEPPVGDLSYGKQLRDGQLLCRVINKLSPGAVKTINTTSSHFKMMENINK